MSRAFEFLIINICVDWSLASRSRFHKRGVGWKIPSCQQNLEKIQRLQRWSYQVRATKETLVYLFESSLAGRLVSRILDLSAIFGACLLWIVAQITKDSSCLQGDTHGQANLSLSSSLVTFDYEDRIHLRTTFSFIPNGNLTGFTPIFSWSI